MGVSYAAALPPVPRVYSKLGPGWAARWLWVPLLGAEAERGYCLAELAGWLAPEELPAPHVPSPLLCATQPRFMARFGVLFPG